MIGAGKSAVWWTTGVLMAALVASCALAAARWRAEPTLPGYLNDHYRDALQYHLRGDALVPARRWLLFGDSLIEGLPASALQVPAVNYGIGSDSVRGVAARLPSYDSVASAQAIVIGAGTNDLARGRDPTIIAADYALLLQRIPAGPRVYCLAVLPVDPSGYRSLPRRTPQRVRSLNTLLEAECTQRGATWVAVPDALLQADGSLTGSAHVGDGLHLGPLGYASWLDTLNAAFAPAP